MTALAAGLIGLVVALPLFLVTIPPFPDLYAHMARLHLLANPYTLYLGDWYRPEWTLVSNLGLDLFAVLASGMGVIAATRLFLICSFILIMSGCAALNRALYKRVSWLPVAASLLLWNSALFAGHANYLFGIGIALWSLAAWFTVLTSKIAIRILVGTVCGMLLFLVHFWSLFFFGLMVLCIEGTMLWRDPQRRVSDILHSVVVAGAPLVLPILLLAADGSIPAFPEFGILPLALVTLNLPIDLIITLGIAAVVGWMIWNKLIYISRRVRVGLIAALLLMPHAGLFLAIAVIRFQSSAMPEARRQIAFALGGLLCLRLLFLMVDLRQIENEEITILARYGQMKPNSVMLSATLAEPTHAWRRAANWSPPWRRVGLLPQQHFDTLAVLFQPVLVAETKMSEIVRLLPPFDALKGLQEPPGDGALRLINQEQLERWLSAARDLLQQPRYPFTAAYVTVLDPAGLAKLPGDTVEVLGAYGYRLWDVSRMVGR